MGAFAAAKAADEGGEDRGGGMSAREHVDRRDPDLDPGTVGLPGDAHEPREPLEHRVVSGQVDVGAGLPEARDRAHDEPAMQRPQVARGEPEPSELPG